MTATDGALRQRLLGVVAGAVAAFGVLLAGAVGAIAGAPAWAWTFVGRRPVVRMSGLLVGFGGAWIALLLVGNSRCDPATCTAPDLAPWLAVGGLLLASGIAGMAIDSRVRDRDGGLVATGLLVSVPAWLALATVGRIDAIHAFVGLGPLVLVPLGLDLALELVPGAPKRLASGLRTLAAPAAVPIALSLVAPPGTGTAILALPWLALGLAAGLVGVANGTHWLVDLARHRANDALARAVSASLVYLAVAAVWLLVDRLGARPFVLDPSIVALTSVHFTFAGFLVVLLACVAAREARTTLGAVAVGLLVVGIPLTATGFLGLPGANLGGAVLTGFGGLATAIVQWQAAGGRLRSARLALRAGSVALAGGMVLALAWATSTALGHPILELRTMAAIHGSLSALGFAAPSVFTWWLTRRIEASSPLL
ncbi:MAG TPA: YndJ family transporter [Candidatus Limnocylindrales bacterium]|nr:YndJ family transporter [Candidatus Limnocylindrales bacterium]